MWRNLKKTEMKERKAQRKKKIKHKNMKLRSKPLKKHSQNKFKNIQQLLQDFVVHVLSEMSFDFVPLNVVIVVFAFLQNYPQLDYLVIMVLLMFHPMNDETQLMIQNVNVAVDLFLMVAVEEI